jgi:MoxR-like ATPase
MSADVDVVTPVGRWYISSPPLDLAVEVARAARRPLLLFGDPGSGKSSLAKYVAYRDGLRYYEHVVTTRTSARDLLWAFDSVRRLADAQAQSLKEDRHYVTPGVLWWAYDRSGAVKLPRPREPFSDWNSDKSNAGAVVLIDEIDKADPDVPNSLLIALGDRRFDVTDLLDRDEVRETGEPSLVVITSNEERDLPPAFVRRCVVFRVEHHDEAMLKKIAEKHVGPVRDYPLDSLVKALLEARTKAKKDHRRMPSTAEFLDAVRACRGHGVSYDKHPDLPGVVKMIFDKAVRDDARHDW